jgi:hypothetical protein
MGDESGQVLVVLGQDAGLKSSGAPPIRAPAAQGALRSVAPEGGDRCIPANILPAVKEPGSPAPRSRGSRVVAVAIRARSAPKRPNGEPSRAAGERDK